MSKAALISRMLWARCVAFRAQGLGVWMKDQLVPSSKRAARLVGERCRIDSKVLLIKKQEQSTTNDDIDIMYSCNC